VIKEVNLFKITIIFIVSVSFVFQFTGAQSDAEGLLKKVQDKFDTITDLSANITQSIKGKTNLSGKVYYKKENKLRFEFKNILIISDGETSWNYNKKENKVIITSYDDETTDQLSINKLIYEYPSECNISTDDADGEKVLVLKPKTASLNFNSAKLWVDNNNLITKVLYDDPAAGSGQIIISNYKLNQNLPESYFSFAPPEGSQIIDLR
jgi:outer membrane lipoprotein-sorting protein